MTENKDILAGIAGVDVFVDVTNCPDAPDGKRYTIIDREKGQETEWEGRCKEQMQRSRMGFGYGD